MKRIIPITVGVVLGAIGASATPLNLTLGLPDIQIAAVSASYSFVDPAGPNPLSVTGTPVLYIDPMFNFIPVTGMGASFVLNASLTGTGALHASGGTFSISGDVGAGFTTLLSGIVTAFGFVDGPSPSAPFEFRGTATGGSLQSLFVPQVGIVIAGPGFAAHFGDDFSFSGVTIDVASTGVPEPGTAFLVLAAGSLVALRRFAR